jgi:uncharacterized membrane-anchored protein
MITKKTCAGVFLSLFALSAAQLCWGDQPAAPVNPPLANAVSTAPANAVSALNQRADLGLYAEIDVPKGYRFIDADAAKVLLEKMNNPASTGLVGILIPDGGKWWAVLEFNEIGYVKDLDKNEDFSAILKAVQERNETQNRESGQGPARIVSVNWQIEPKYDADVHSLEWAFLAEGQSGKVVNHTIALLGRRGVLNITTVQPYKASEDPVDSVPLSDLVKKITFKEDQRYADYQIGDKVASGGVKALVVGQPSDANAKQGVMEARSVPSTIPPMYLIVGSSVVLGGGLLAYSQLRRKKKKVPAWAYTNGHAAPALTNGTNGHPARRKVFNYHKFYSDMVMQLSGHTYSWAAPANGHSHPRAASAPVVATSTSQALANANLELIACQKTLIEEQRNLMREQARVIEEKAKLIKEYNQLMEKWSEDIGDQFSLKLD